MRIALIAITALVFYCYSSASSAQNDGFQSVSGDFAKNWLKNFLAKNPKSGMPSSGTESSSSVGSFSGTGHTPWQQGVIEGLRIGFHMGQMHALADQGQNISGFNAEVDRYNAWVQKNLGNDPNLMMPKMQETGYSNVPSMRLKPIHKIDESFNQSRRILGDTVAWNEGRIMDMPASAYYTWNPNAIPQGSGYISSQTYGALGSV
jgi:hypothetical protein